MLARHPQLKGGLLRQLRTMLTATMLMLLAAGCSGGDEKAAPTPPGSYTGGGATVTMELGGDTWTYEDGVCTKGGQDRYLSLNAGNPAGDEYFGLVVGQFPGVEGTPKAATGGGTFSGQSEAILRFRHERRDYLVKFVSTQVTLAADISSGSFVSELTSGAGEEAAAVRGTFTCG